MNELIQVLIVYLASVGFSCAFLIAAVVKVIKHLLDNGYILNMNKANEHKSDPTLLTISLLIPVYNIVFSAKHYNDTMKEMPYVLNAFKVGDFLDELTEEQKRRYNENPSFLEVMKILLEQKGNQHEQISFNKSKIISVLPFDLVKRDKRYIEQYIIEAIKKYNKIYK